MYFHFNFLPSYQLMFPYKKYIGNMLPHLYWSNVTLRRQFVLKQNAACTTYFGHISTMEAWIFMKFETYVYKIVFDHQPNFHKDPCKDAHMMPYKNSDRSQQKSRKYVFRPFWKNTKKSFLFTFSNQAKILWAF